MKKTILALAIALTALGASAPAFAYGTIWCKVSLGTIQACFKTFDQCSSSLEFGECKPYQE